ncbi:hypothetical protein ACHQM5_013474 [Ranunculus cassubicifolius]
MCPLRLILLFLSASLAGFFVLRNLNSKPEEIDTTTDNDHEFIKDSSDLPRSSKICSAIGSGFWTCVDMASGKYLWRNLAPSANKNQ